MVAHRLPDWRVVLLAGVVAAVLLGSVGFVVQRMAFEVRDREALDYVHQPPTPFERQIRLAADHTVVLSDGDEALWYYGASVVLVLTLAVTPLLRDRQARAGR